MGWKRKDLLSMQDLEAAEITDVLDTAESMKEIATREIKKVPTLRGKTVVNLFYEASTRTRTSFEIAGKWLSADVINFSASGSSAEKGESLLDTAKNIEAMSPDVVVVRHKASGTPALLARNLACSVVNAGDGAHEHPTQALLDLLTIRQKKGHLDGLNVTIVGDVAHSRVARSDIHGMRKMGITVTVAGPPTLIPAACQELGVKVSYRLEEAIANSDVIMMLRLQQERMEGGLIPSLREYSRVWGLSLAKLQHCRPDGLIRRSSSRNRGAGRATDLPDSPYSARASSPPMAPRSWTPPAKWSARASSTSTCTCASRAMSTRKPWPPGRGRRRREGSQPCAAWPIPSPSMTTAPSPITSWPRRAWRASSVSIRSAPSRAISRARSSPSWPSWPRAAASHSPTTANA